MPCSLPPPLNDDQLEAVLDGKAEPDILQHLAQCPDCSARLAEARKVEQMLTSVLYRWDCPSAQQLGNYHLQMVTTEETTAINRHLDTCAHCQAELAELRGFLAAEQPARPIMPPTRVALPRLGDLIAQLLPRTPQFALRGAASGPIVAQAGDITIFLELQPTLNGAELAGQLAADELQPWIGALVTAHQAGQFQVSAVVDELGTFRCGPLGKAPVDIRISIPAGRSIFLKNLNLDA